MRYLLENRTKRYIDKLQDFVDSYNQTPNSVFKMAPSQVTEENSAVVRSFLYPTMKPLPLKTPKFKVGQHVRISMERRAVGDKGYDINWSIPVYTIVSVHHREPDREVYRLREYFSDETLEGTWYPEELQVVEPPTEFRIDKVLRKRWGPDKKRQLLVLWQGYKNPSWILEEDLV